MKAGGKLLDLEKQEQLKKAEAEQRESSYKSPDSSGYSFDAYGGTLRNEDPDLFEMVLNAISFFTR